MAETEQILAEAEIGRLYMELETHLARTEDTKRRINEAKQKLVEILNAKSMGELHNGRNPDG